MLKKLSVLDFSETKSETLKSVGNLAVKLLALYGASVVAKKTIRAGKEIYQNYFKSGHNLIERYGENSTALITSGSGGIGHGFAEELIERGFNLVIIGRTKENLDKTVASLKNINPKATITPIVADFTNSLQDGFFDDVFKQIEGIDISLVVNSVGKFVADGFNNQKESEIIDQAIVNVIPALIITRRLLPKLLAREKKSGVIFLSSITGTYPRKGSAVYSATKACLDFVSRGLAIEHGQKIDFLSLRPFAVSTQLTCNAKKGCIIITPRDCAKAALSKLGIVSYTYGHWKHSISGWLYTSSPFRYLLIGSVRKDMLEGAEKNKGTFDVSHILRN